MSRHVILVGGGLANGLIAWRLRQVAPTVRVTMLEREATLGGHHVWCFHGTDVSPEQRRWLEPLVDRSWSGYEVRFPALDRVLEGSYHAITSERLHEQVAGALGADARCSTAVRRVRPREVALWDGTTVRGDLVIDGRGAYPTAALRVAYQKFVGLWLALERDHGLERPLLMDATVEQRDGFRFVYTLPFSSRLLHVEDTRYSDGAELDDDEYREQILRYAEVHGWSVADIEREERGILPIVLDGDLDAMWEEGSAGVPRSGMRAALFHPTTGYSLPDAVRLADALPARIADAPGVLDAWIHGRARETWQRGRYFRLLNRMLFHAAEPDQRYRVLERFYALPTGLIQRFYRGQLSYADRLRILVGRPPVPVHRALGCVLSGRHPTLSSRPAIRRAGPGSPGAHGA